MILGLEGLGSIYTQAFEYCGEASYCKVTKGLKFYGGFQELGAPFW